MKPEPELVPIIRTFVIGTSEWVQAARAEEQWYLILVGFYWY